MGSATHHFEVQAPISRVYAYWRDFSNFPEFMPDVKQVEVTGPQRSHWEVAGPLGTTARWDAEIIEDVPNERIAWRSTEDSKVSNEGFVQFEDRGLTTGVEISLRYDPPAGKLGEVVTDTFKDPDDQVRRAAEAFRELTESWV